MVKTMNLLLDMKTIFITLVCGNFFTVFLISAYWQHQKHNKILTTFLQQNAYKQLRGFS